MTIPPTPEILKNVLSPLYSVKGLPLKGVHYYNPCGNNCNSFHDKGVHITGQSKLDFDSRQIYISWEQSSDWYDYTIGCSHQSFFEDGLDVVDMTDSGFWQHHKGMIIDSVEVWGSEKGYWHGKGKDEPHLIAIHHGSLDVVSFADFGEEKNFVPKYAGSDDLWVINGNSLLAEFTNKLGLVRLCSVSLMK
jgi:hypothetical protein